MKTLVGLTVLLALSACGPQDAVVDGAEVDSAEGVAALTAGEWRIRVGTTTVWIDSSMTPAVREGRPVFLVKGRASRNLSHVQSFVPDDPFGFATLTGARSFEVALDSSGEMNSIARGTRLLIGMNAAGVAETITAGVTFLPTLVSAGSTKINVHPEIVSALVADQVVYRAIATTTSGTALATVANKDGSGPAMSQLSARTWRLEWKNSDGIIQQGRRAASDPLIFTATGQVVRTAQLVFSVGTLGATMIDPYEYWKQPACKASVKTCLINLKGAPDTSSCGDASEVLRCKSQLPQPAPVITADLFATHLSNSLNREYGFHAAEIAAAGGNTLQQAQDFVQASKVSEVTSSAADPHGHDVTKMIVFRHPDPIYPGSGAFWFGVYDRSNGALQDLYRSN